MAIGGTGGNSVRKQYTSSIVCNYLSCHKFSALPLVQEAGRTAISMPQKEGQSRPVANPGLLLQRPNSTSSINHLFFPA
jgi:hypothetical protein